MNIIIPMGGKGQRFIDAGYTVPKPFIDVLGTPMYQLAINNLANNAFDQFVFIVSKDHKDYLCDILTFCPRSKIVIIDQPVSGSVPACLLAEDYVPPFAPLVIANCDQIIDWNSYDFYTLCNASSVDGIVPTFKAVSNAHSYARQENGIVVEIKEKQVISDDALCGVHFWRTADMAFRSFRKSLAGPPHFNGDYYIAPTYNELIKEGKKIITYHTNGMTILGTPEKLEEYILGDLL